MYIIQNVCNRGILLKLQLNTQFILLVEGARFILLKMFGSKLVCICLISWYMFGKFGTCILGFVPINLALEDGLVPS